MPIDALLVAAAWLLTAAPTSRLRWEMKPLNGATIRVSSSAHLRHPLGRPLLLDLGLGQAHLAVGRGDLDPRDLDLGLPGRSRAAWEAS